MEVAKFAFLGGRRTRLDESQGCFNDRETEDEVWPGSDSVIRVFFRCLRMSDPSPECKESLSKDTTSEGQNAKEV